MVEQYSGRLSIGDTDIGQVLKDNITDLEKLLVAYRSGVLNQRG
jgi:fructose-1,6-bisphosphatase